MPKPYSLSLYDSVLNATQRFQKSLTAIAKGWKRGNRSMGGCWQGTFRVTGDATELQHYWEEWLGFDVRERAAGFLSWAGLVYEMDLTKNGITRRRTLDLMANRVKTTYLTLDFVGDNFVENASFEDYTIAAPSWDFWAWAEFTGTAGAIGGAAPGHTGAMSVGLTGDTDGGGPSGGGGTYIRQNISVTPGAKYRLSFWTQGDGGVGGTGNFGWVGIDDPNTANYNWILQLQQTFWATATWKQITRTFIGPSEGEIMLYFCAPDNNGRIAFFDDIEIMEEAECVYETQWAQVEDTAPFTGPQLRYGVKEEIVHLDGYPDTTSLAYRNTYLAENAWPWPRPVSVAKRGEATLDVLVCGYVWTANWLYAMQGDGAPHDLDAWIALLIGSAFGRDPLHGGATANAGDCQFLRTGVIRPNEYIVQYYAPPLTALQVNQLAGVEERPWDVIQELTALGDAGGNQWRAWADAARLFHYEPITTAPRYYIRGDGIYDTMAGRVPSNPWLMQPAVFRDLGYRFNRAQEKGSFLLTPQDLYVDEVVMADGYEQPDLKTTTFSEAAIIQAQAERG